MPRKLVSISESTLEKLGNVAKPFESPGQCVDRLLDELKTNQKDSSVQTESNTDNEDDVVAGTEGEA
ncbi:MAG: hypothetical protein IH841_08525 [Thaumarchaeota archaeon]|nr:hypothetical protein [Nitrososphaerota archaeon]